MKVAKVFMWTALILMVIGFADTTVRAEREAGYLLILSIVFGLIGMVTYFSTSRVCGQCGSRVPRSYPVCRHCGAAAKGAENG